MILESFLPNLARRANVVFVEMRLGVCPSGKLSCPTAHVGGLAVVIDIAVRSIELLRSGEDHEKFLLWHFETLYPKHEQHASYRLLLAFPVPSPRAAYETPTATNPISSPLYHPKPLVRIRIRRLEWRLTVKECAQKLKVTAKTLHASEKHRHRPARGMQKQIVEFLHG